LSELLPAADASALAALPAHYRRGAPRAAALGLLAAARAAGAAGVSAGEAAGLVPGVDAAAASDTLELLAALAVAGVTRRYDRSGRMYRFFAPAS
jgi:hypothetical protein